MDRRGFLKAGACAACFCGFGSMFKLMAGNTISADNASATTASADAASSDTAALQSELTETQRSETFALQWITELLKSLESCELSDSQLRSIVKATSAAHHDLLNVPEMVKPYLGKPDEFIGFLRNAWGWKVEDNKTARQLIVDEDKPFCVCPLLKNNKDTLFPALCYCSEGFAERMFSYVYGHPVSVRVATSVQRGDPTCIYHINY